MRVRHWAMVAALSCAAATAALAQDDGPGDGKSFNITANFQAQAIVAAGADTQEMAKSIAKLQASLSDVVAKQCDVLAAAFKGSCAVLQLNMNSNIEGRHRFANGDAAGQKRAWASVNATFVLTPPAAEPSPTPQ